MLRGGIISLIFQESVRLDLNTHGVNPAAAITLVNTDASIIFGVVHQLHEIWSSCVAIAVAIYLIYRETGAASALPLALAIGTLSHPLRANSPLLMTQWAAADI